MFFHVKIQGNKKKGDWIKKQIVWVFWNNHVTELREKSIYKNNEYASTRFEELCTYSGEVLSTREHKAITSKRKQNIFITIDELKVYKGNGKSDKLKAYNDLFNK